MMEPAPLPENWERQVTKMVICTFSTPRRSQHFGDPGVKKNERKMHGTTHCNIPLPTPFQLNTAA